MSGNPYEPPQEFPASPLREPLLEISDLLAMAAAWGLFLGLPAALVVLMAWLLSSVG